VEERDMSNYDAIVIGAGQSEPALAHRLTETGMHSFWGCINTGCTPTKTLVAGSDAAHVVRRAGEFGVLVDGAVTVDMKKVMAREDYVAGFSSKGSVLTKTMPKVSDLYADPPPGRAGMTEA
jgi:pyruvate/2-oxoglutarate dehydrogenase complex dihydrolipoamide dehydrogenase (E3) component